MEGYIKSVQKEVKKIKPCPYDKTEGDCMSWVPNHGESGRCGIQKGDNEITNMKRCARDKAPKDQPREKPKRTVWKRPIKRRR